MNPLEFSSKSLLFYSLRQNKRIDLSCLPDDVFDQVLAGLFETRMCVEGNAYTGKYVKDSSKASPFLELLTSLVAGKYWPLNALIVYIDDLRDGDVFRVVSEDAPTTNKQLAILKTRALATDVDERIIHNDYLIRWGMIAARCRHYAFGYDGLKTVIGEGDKNKRICRFCGKGMPDVTFRSIAHALPEGLGNKELICNEECNSCNNKLSKVESNLMHYLDVRRAMGGILTKTDGTVPSVDGKGFVIRGDENNQAVLYLEREWLDAQGIDSSKAFCVKLETGETITHQGIYKSLCKIVIDLLPTHELSHFSETIGWINGSVMDEELPPYYASYGREQVKQPTVDIFLSNQPGREPYCMAVVHILDVLFAFVLPEIDVDKAQFKNVESVRPHLARILSAWGGHWHVEDSCEYTLATPWVYWQILPDDPQVDIRPASDSVFTRYKKEGKTQDEKVFPEFIPVGIEDPVIASVRFERHTLAPVTVSELQQVSVNYERLVCRLDKAASTIVFSMDFNFSDSSNRQSYFDFGFDAKIKLEDFDKYIETGDYFCIDYHLRDYLCALVMAEAQKVLWQRYTVGTDLEPVTVEHLLEERTVRQMYYIVPVGEERYMFVKDAEIHNL